MSDAGADSYFEGRSVYERVIKVMLDFHEVADLKETVHPEFMGYGSAAHELFRTREDMKKMAEMQAEQLRDADFSYTRRPVSEKVFAGGDACLILEEIQLFFPGNDHQLQVRLSALLEKIDGKWLVTHFHGSSPDTDIAEDEAFPEEGLRRKNEELEAKIRERTRDLEVEAALERARAQSMLMQHSGELSKVSRAFHEQLMLLGIDSEFSFVWLPNETDNTHVFWSTWADGPEGSPNFHSRTAAYPMDRSEPYTAACFADWESGTPVHEHFVPPKDLEAFLASWSAMLEGAEHLKPENFPEGIYYTEAFMKYGCFGIDIRRPLSEAEKTILHRFANEFERAYTRFLDLQKAEAQAREAEIELALERVRASTMAMQHSNELSEASNLLDQQVRSLGIATRGCAFHIYRENDSLEWFGDNFNAMEPYTVPREGVFKRYYEAGRRGETLYTESFEGDACRQHYEFLCSLPVLGVGLRKAQEAGLVFPEKQYDHVAYFKYGYLLFITLEPVAGEDKNVFTRFAAVFEQTYTRFLDLQKAEAQAREAQIEVALERVRAGTMAMHSSKDLSKVTSVLFEQMRLLGGDLFSFGIVLCDKNEDKVEQWHSLGDGEMTSPFQVPVDLDYIHRFRYDQWKAGEPLFSIEIPKDYIGEHFEKMFALPSVKAHMDAMAAQGITVEVPSWEIDYGASFSHGYLLVSSLAPFEESHIFPRFARVFEQAYTRFLDLQKAEAQARESQIEAALERVRSRTMAMQSSEELKDVAFELRKQMGSLEIAELETCAIHLYEGSEDYFTSWAASKSISKESGFVLSEIHFPKKGVSSLEEIIDLYYKKTMDYVVTNDHDRLSEFMEVLKEHAPETHDVVLDTFQNALESEIKTYWALADFQGGSLVISTTTIPGEETRALLRRFANVFNLSYQRFSDLKQAEAQAREARIEAALERVRSRSMAMDKSEELTEVATVLQKELINLEVSTFSVASIVVFDEPTNQQMVWGARTGTDSEFLEMSVMPLLGDPILQELYDKWQSGEAFFTVKVGGLALKNHKDFVFPIADRTEILDRALEQMPDPTFFHCAVFSKGYLELVADRELPDESALLLKRFAKVFDQVYTRFLDLQLKEEQAVKLVAEKQRLEKTLRDLQATQKQLVHAEKMASLGELTAGIAHEIQNPLNFVNNFSEVSRELLEELMEELKKGDTEEVDAIARDVVQNLEKIVHHGKRADSIVKGMLQHSRSGNGIKEPTDLNALAEEYLRLAYHGLRAKDKSFNATMATDFDEAVEPVEVIPQDIGRVLLNLVTNAFHAVAERKKHNAGDYDPRVTVKSRKTDQGVEILVIDNGGGIPEAIREKIFQPFFTTKPTGEGTGLGLSMSYDIVNKGHGGELTMQTTEGEGTVFKIVLPVNMDRA